MKPKPSQQRTELRARISALLEGDPWAPPVSRCPFMRARQWLRATLRI